MRQRHWRLRILFFTAEPWPTFRADVAVLFGKELPRHGICVDLVTSCGVDIGSKWGGGEARFCRLAGGKGRRMMVTLLHRLRCLAGADPGRYQAIQVRDLPVFAAVAYLMARWKRLPFYYWMSYPMPEGNILLAKERGLSAGIVRWVYNMTTGYVGGWLLYRFVLPRADHVFLQSERMREDMAARGIPPTKTTPVPMGVDWEKISTFADLPPTADPRLEGRRVLVYLGTQVRPRRIDILFEMLALVRKRVPDALLVLVGDAEDFGHRAWLRQRAVVAGVADHVVWTGWLPMEEGWRYVRAAKVGLSPIPRGSLLDVGSPTKVNEYLALGVPVVCNDNPDQAAMIAACGAGLCVPYTAQDFAGAVLSLLALSDEERAKWVEAGMSYVVRHRDYRKLGVELANTYQTLAERPLSEWISR